MPTARNMTLGHALALLLGSAVAERVTVDGHGRTRSQAAQLAASSRSGCQDERPDCADIVGERLELCGSDPVNILTKCIKTCQACEYISLVREAMECADTHENCRSWAAAGECDKNPRFMLNGCAVACKTCETKQSGCARQNSTSVVPVPGGLNAMFERAMSDFPQYAPTALSRPSSPGADDAPWIVQFENLVTAEEAQAMLDACPKLERSLAGDQLSPVRTSSQCWCDGDCLRDEVVHNVTMRMLEVTQLPYENAEYFQILRYEPGQFYRQHHDQQSGHWTPQGARLYTFFVYLSDVEEGGGTRFTDLDVTVTPQLGRGILWPSVRDDTLRVSDKRTHHEALTVVKGVKYAANLWQHVYDFKTPSKAGLCAFLGKNSNH